MRSCGSHHSLAISSLKQHWIDGISNQCFVFIRLNQIPFNSQRFICSVLSLSFITHQLCKTHHPYNTKTRHIIPWSYNRLSSGLKSGWFHTDVLSLAKSVSIFKKIISKQFMFSRLKIHSCAAFNFFFLNIQYSCA